MNVESKRMTSKIKVYDCDSCLQTHHVRTKPSRCSFCGKTKLTKMSEYTVDNKKNSWKAHQITSPFAQWG